MKKLSVLLVMALFYCGTTWAQSSCFLVQENQTVLKHEGKDCNKRFAPESTFKIALSLMGFDSEILKDDLHPEWRHFTVRATSPHFLKMVVLEVYLIFFKPAIL